jgi:TM2 domain-containing membrane protein YozV
MEALTRGHAAPGDTAAAILSLILPGAGQIYQGKTAAGILWTLVTVGLYLTVWLPGALAHFACVLEAYWSPPEKR